jgi:hypothetical protein
MKHILLKAKRPYDPKQLEIGRRVEMEHTSDPEEAEKIARDHLDEKDDYYTDPPTAKEFREEAEKRGLKKGMRLVILVKGKAPIGETRVWGGKTYRKTEKGWRPVSKKAAESTPKKAEKEEKARLAAATGSGFASGGSAKANVPHPNPGMAPSIDRILRDLRNTGFGFNRKDVAKVIQYKGWDENNLTEEQEHYVWVWLTKTDSNASTLL